MADKVVRRQNACIVVLGDIGHSPRMQYHAVSLLESNYNVDLVGYVESRPLEQLTAANPICKIHELSSVPETNLTPKLKLIFKTIWQALSLLIALASIRRPSFLLLQNPPGIPAMPICYLYCLFTRTKFVIDWHNYTYTILGLGMPGGESNCFCKMAKLIEEIFGRKADSNFCVTKAMQEDLKSNWKIGNVNVLYDRPHERFHPTDLAKKHDLFMRLSQEYSDFMGNQDENLNNSTIIESSAMTQKLEDGSIQNTNQRTALLVSSTSWTPDEDFNILLDALNAYESEAAKHPDVYPLLLCVITGKGPQKEEFRLKINKLNFTRVIIITPWLEAEDYPTLLSAADLGVCLHWSSSGLDLPMKVVDMFGCGIPVCAYNFKSIQELVKPNENGFIFNSSKELASQLLFWFENFPNNPRLILSKEIFRKNTTSFQNLRWRENWKNVAQPVFNSFL